MSDRKKMMRKKQSYGRIQKRRRCRRALTSEDEKKEYGEKIGPHGSGDGPDEKRSK